MTPEQIASQRVRLAASSLGCRLFRNNSGGFYDEQGRFVRFGLGNESAQLNQQLKFGDYVGITPIVITPEMVGKTVGIFTNLEVKPEGMLNATINKASKGNCRESAQLMAINLVKSIGGIGGFVTCESDVSLTIREYVEGIQK